MSANVPLHLKRLLVCTDGSPASQGAVDAGLWLGGQCGAKVVLLSVAGSGVGEASREMSAVREGLEEVRRTAAAAGVALEVRIVRAGSPLEGIRTEAQAVNPDWIILGRRGSTSLSQLLMGSVTARVIGHCPHSVLVVPKEVTLRFQRILVASDGSPDSEAAWREAIIIAERAKSEVVAVSVARNESMQNDCQLLMQHLEASAARHGVSFEGNIVNGRPFEAISQAADEEGADLVVMGTHGRTGLAGLLMGSVAERVIGMVNCAVLVAKMRHKE